MNTTEKIAYYGEFDYIQTLSGSGIDVVYSKINFTIYHCYDPKYNSKLCTKIVSHENNVALHGYNYYLDEYTIYVGNTVFSRIHDIYT